MCDATRDMTPSYVCVCVMMCNMRDKWFVTFVTSIWRLVTNYSNVWWCTHSYVCVPWLMVGLIHVYVWHNSWQDWFICVCAMICDRTHCDRTHWYTCVPWRMTGLIHMYVCHILRQDSFRWDSYNVCMRHASWHDSFICMCDVICDRTHSCVCVPCLATGLIQTGLSEKSWHTYIKWVCVTPDSPVPWHEWVRVTQLCADFKNKRFFGDEFLCSKKLSCELWRAVSGARRLQV